MEKLSVFFYYVFFLAIFLIAPLQGATPNPWHVTTIKDLGILPAGAVLRSTTLEHPDKKRFSEEARINAVLFSTSSFYLELIDSPARNRKLSQLMEGSKFFGGVNGGYFHPNGTPLGLVIIHGKKIHSQEKAQLLSGLVVTTHDTLSLLRFEEKLPAHIENALQAGPFLVDHGTTAVGLEATRVAGRTFLATDNHGHWMMGVISPVTLAEAAQIVLAASSTFFKTTKIERALNLDGGSSSALWARVAPTPFSQEEFRYVRNFLGLKMR